MNWHRFSEREPPEAEEVLCGFMYASGDAAEFVVATRRGDRMTFDDAPSSPIADLVADNDAFWCNITPPEVR